MGFQKITLHINGNKNLHKTNATIIDSIPLLGIISDFDDTMIVSDVTNKIKLGFNMMFKNYKQRTLVPSILERFKKILAQVCQAPSLYSQALYNNFLLLSSSS